MGFEWRRPGAEQLSVSPQGEVCENIGQYSRLEKDYYYAFVPMRGPIKCGLENRKLGVPNDGAPGSPTSPTIEKSWRQVTAARSAKSKPSESKTITKPTLVNLV